MQSLFTYTRDHFFKSFSLFQDTEHKHLFCVFDEADNLIEACYYEKSDILQTFVKFRSVQIKADRLVELFGNFRQEWIGPGGIIVREDKDRNVFEEKWTRESKLKELLSQMVEAYHASKETGASEIDRELEWKAKVEKHKRDFVKANFSNWPKNLTENRFLTWQSINPKVPAIEFEKFFESLKVKGHLHDLSEDLLGAELSKWLPPRHDR